MPQRPPKFSGASLLAVSSPVKTATVQRVFPAEHKRVAQGRRTEAESPAILQMIWERAQDRSASPGQVSPAAFLVQHRPENLDASERETSQTPQKIRTAGSVGWSAYTCKVQKCNLDCRMCLLSGQERMSPVQPDMDRYALSRRWYYHAAQDDGRERF